MEIEMEEKEADLRHCDKIIRRVEELAEGIIQREKDPYYASLFRDMYDLGIIANREKNRQKELL